MCGSWSGQEHRAAKWPGSGASCWGGGGYQGRHGAGGGGVSRLLRFEGGHHQQLLPSISTPGITRWPEIPVNKRRWPNAGLMLGQRRRLWPGIKPALGWDVPALHTTCLSAWERDGWTFQSEFAQWWMNVGSASPTLPQHSASNGRHLHIKIPGSKWTQYVCEPPFFTHPPCFGNQNSSWSSHHRSMSPLHPQSPLLPKLFPPLLIWGRHGGSSRRVWGSFVQHVVD